MPTRSWHLTNVANVPLIRAQPQQFEALDSRKVSEDPTWAHLAVCGEEVFIRELNAMAAFRWRSRP